MLRKRLGSFVLVSMLATVSQANVWLITHRTITNGNGDIAVSGTESISNAPNSTLLTEYTNGSAPSKASELFINGKHYEMLSVKSDKSEVIGRYTDEQRQTKWCIYNFARMQAEQKVTVVSPSPGYEIVDVRYVNDRVAMLQRKGESFRCDESASGKEWQRTFASDDGDLSQLRGFPQASAGNAAMEIASKMPFVAPQGTTIKYTDPWWNFFGPRGSSDLGAFDPVSGIVAVRSTWGNDDVLTISRATPQGFIAPIKLSKPGFLQQIAVIGDVTYVVLNTDTVLSFDRTGKQIAKLRGTRVLVR